MKRMFFSMAVIAAFAAIVVTSTASGVRAEMFMKIVDIPGEAVESKHKDWIEITSLQWGVSMLAETHVGGGSAGGKPDFSDLSWSQGLDKSIPKLFEATASGKHISNVEIDFVTSGTDMNVKYFEMLFGDVQLTSIMMNGTSDSRPTYEGSFAYGRLKMIYTQFFDESGKPKGDVAGEYDLIKGKGSAGALASLFAMGLLGPSNNSTPVPIPAAAWLLGSGLVGLVVIRRKFRKA